jgi:hypothetical protein
MAKEAAHSSTTIEDPGKSAPAPQPQPGDNAGQPEQAQQQDKVGEPELVDPKQPPVPAQPGMPENSSPTPGTPKDL